MVWYNRLPLQIAFQFFPAFSSLDCTDILIQLKKLVKDLKNEIALPLSIMINTSIESGRVPGTMKLAKVIPIYKSKDKQMLNNYRPISLLPIIRKL